MQDQRVLYLIERYAAGSISERELAEFMQILEADPQTSGLPELIKHWLEERDEDPAFDQLHWQPVLKKVLQADKQARAANLPAIPLFRRSWFRYAAAVLIIGSVALFWWSSRRETKDNDEIVRKTDHQQNVPPGKDGAILTLADGTQIVLDSLGNGEVVKEKGSVVMLKDGKLSYNNQVKDPATIVYNTMTTPRGRQFNVQLPDGTQVWLNAASSLRYPTRFSGQERKVELTGEAYFEVAKNKQMPFRVEVKGLAEIEVLGTHFNVNAYTDEPSLNTTLLEGSVQVSEVKEDQLRDDGVRTTGIKPPAAVVLQPGEQARIFISHQPQTQNGSVARSIQVQQVDVKEVIAWKNGAFVFNDADLPAVMRQLARWYDVEVEYKGEIPKGLFNGKIGRGLTLAEVLEGLKETNVKYRIENGNKIVVLP